MHNKKKLRLKKLKIHPITTYLILIFFTFILSFILSTLKIQTTYTTINTTDLSVVQNTAMVENLFNFDGLKYIISNASKNFISFAPLSMFLLISIGISVLESSGLLDYLSKKIFSKISSKVLTFIIIFLGIISTIINDIGYLILLPLAAMIFKAKKRSPVAGVMAAFCGIAFGAGTTLFVGSMEVNLIPHTTSVARIVDEIYHVSLTSNLYIMIATTIILSIVGTLIVEKLIVPKYGRLNEKRSLDDDDVDVIDVDELEQEKLNRDYNEKKGIKRTIIVSIILIFIFIYSVIPGLPLSGLLLDMSEKTYLKQIFGENSYFQDGFTFMISLLLIIPSLAYGFGAKKFKSDRDVFDICHDNLDNLGGVLILVFLASQFIALFKKTNIGIVLTGIIANVIDSMKFGGIPLLLISIILMVLCGLFVTTPQVKWQILAPAIIPPLIQSNISPQFVQFIFRACDSISKGITPLAPFFVIFLAYMNIYNDNKNDNIGVFSAIKTIMPYCLIISATWLIIIIGWYIIGLPIGPSVYPTV